MKLLILVIIAAIAIYLIVIFWLIPDRDNEAEERMPEADTEQQTGAEMYRNETYNYSFTYPTGWGVQEYTPEAIAIGSTTTQGFDSVAEVAVIKSSDGEHQNYDAFFLEKAKILCAADSPTETINCGEITATSSYTADTGLAGEEFYLELLRTDLQTNETATSTFGPLYAFDIGPNATTSEFAALLVYQPLASYLQEPQSSLVREIAGSVQTDLTERR